MHQTVKISLGPAQDLISHQFPQIFEMALRVERHLLWGISLLFWNAVVVCDNGMKMAERV